MVYLIRLFLKAIVLHTSTLVSGKKKSVFRLSSLTGDRGLIYIFQIPSFFFQTFYKLNSLLNGFIAISFYYLK